MLNTKMIGNRIAEARKKAAISQAQLAERLCISSQAVGKWERGESLPDIITLNRLAEILGVDLNYFSEVHESGSPEKIASGIPMATSAELPAGKQKKLKWDMSRGNWADADFSGLNNLNEKFGSSNMQRCKFIGSDLSELLLKNNNVDSCDFSESDISNSRFQHSNLVNNQFNSCKLNETEFSGSYICGCDFSGADLTAVKVKSGGFEKNTFTNVIWENTSFDSSYIANTIFEGTLENCAFENCAFKKVTFQNAMLINTFFKNRSLKQIQFIDCKADRMTYEFLKNGKANLSGITLLVTDEN